MSNVLPNIKRLLNEAVKDSGDVLAYATAKRDAEPDDFSFWAVDITVGEHCESGVNDSEYFTVDMETGILIIEAARKIIAERASSVVLQEREAPCP
jgi:hypothetical protein